jgi:tight adherence protein B
MLMSSCLRSGHSWAGAMEMAARDMEPPMAEELTRLLLETQRGVSWEEAFKNLLRRAPSVDLELIIVAILTQREVGGNLGEILAKILYTVQERVRLQGEIRVLASQGVLSGLVVGLLPISVGALLTLIEPTYLQPLLASRVGQIMLGGSLLLQALGGLVIKKLVSIEY